MRVAGARYKPRPYHDVGGSGTKWRESLLAGCMRSFASFWEIHIIAVSPERSFWFDALYGAHV